MQTCRKIERIGEEKAKKEITAENYTEYEQFINDSIKRKNQNYDR